MADPSLITELAYTGLDGGPVLFAGILIIGGAILTALGCRLGRNKGTTK